MTTIPDNQDFPHWPERKLLIVFHLLQSTQKSRYPLHEFIFPVRYPSSLTTPDWEAYRTFLCLAHLEEAGIRVRHVLVDPLLLIVNQAVHETHPEKLTKLDIRYVLKRLKSPHNESLDTQGEGEFIQMNGNPQQANLWQLLFPRFFYLEIDVNPGRIKSSLATYLKQYRAGVLQHSRSSFGFSFMNRLLTKFLKATAFRQGHRVHLSLQSGPEDEFIQLFRKEFPQEYQLWKKGNYRLPFFTHLIAFHHFGKLTLDTIKVKPTEDNHDLGTLAYHQAPMDIWIDLTLIRPKAKRHLPFTNKPIKLIEATQTDDNEYFVYLNGQYDKPLFFNRKNKSGDLIYRLARDGYTEHKGFERVYEYINSDNRFKLFAKSNFALTRLLDRDDDGYIITAKAVSIRLLRDSPESPGSTDSWG